MLRQKQTNLYCLVRRPTEQPIAIGTQRPYRTLENDKDKETYLSFMTRVYSEKSRALRTIPESTIYPTRKLMCQVQNQLNIHIIYIEDCNAEWNGLSGYKRNIQLLNTPTWWPTNVPLHLNNGWISKAETRKRNLQSLKIGAWQAL